MSCKYCKYCIFFVDIQINYLAQNVFKTCGYNILQMVKKNECLCGVIDDITNMFYLQQRDNDIFTRLTNEHIKFQKDFYFITVGGHNIKDDTTIVFIGDKNIDISKYDKKYIRLEHPNILPQILIFPIKNINKCNSILITPYYAIEDAYDFDYSHIYFMATNQPLFDLKIPHKFKFVYKIECKVLSDNQFDFF